MAAAAVKGLRVDLRGAAGRPWVPKREGPREDEAAAGHELCEFEEAGCRPRGGDAGGGQGRGAAGQGGGGSCGRCGGAASGRRGSWAPTLRRRISCALVCPLALPAPGPSFDSGCFISGETCTVVGRKELLFQLKEEGF